MAKIVRFLGRAADGGNDSSVSVAHHASLNFNATFTAIARVYIDPNFKNPQGESGIVSKADGSGAGGGFWLEFADFNPALKCFRFSMTYGAALSQSAYAANTVLTAGWYHVVVTFDQSLGMENMKVFQNAVRVAAANQNQLMNTNLLNVTIGGITAAGWMLNGYISEIQIYNRVLTEAEINYCYLHPNVPIRRGCVLSLIQDQIDEPAAGTWRDTSPQTGNNGTINNATTHTATNLKSRCNALWFDVGDYLYIQDNPNLSPADLTLETWILLDQRPLAGGWIGKASDIWANLEYALRFVSASGVRPVSFVTNHAVVGVVDTQTAVTDPIDVRQWYHIVATWAQPNKLIYINGVQKATGVVNQPLVGASGSHVIIGGYAFGAGLGFTHTGYMASSRIYDRALTAGEVAYNYNHPQNPVRRGLVVNLSQESIYGSMWRDLSGNNNNAQFVGPVARRMGLLSGR